MRWIVRVALLLCAAFFAAASASHGLQPGSAQRGWIVWGYVGKTPQEPAPGERVMLVNAQGEVVGTAVADGTGKFVLAYHKPGEYRLKVATLELPVVIAAQDQRIDVDLSNPTGAMSYAAAGAKGKGGARAPSTGPVGQVVGTFCNSGEVFARQLTFDGNGGFTYESTGGMTVHATDSGGDVTSTYSSSMNKGNSGSYSVQGDVLLLHYDDGSQQQFKMYWKNGQVNDLDGPLLYSRELC